MKKRMVAVSLAVLGVVGCGGGGGSGTLPQSHPGDFEGFWNAYLDALCDLSLQCEAKSPLYGLTELLACHPGTFQRMIDESFDELERALADGRITWNEDEANRCLDAIRAVDQCQVELVSVVGEACAGIFSGNVPSGGECAEDAECVSGRCDLDVECPGTCVALLGAGAECGSDDECELGLLCGASGTCEPYSIAAGECRTGSDCPSGLCSGGTCVAMAGAGQSCDHDLFSAACAGNLVCSGGSSTDPGTCTAGAGAGDACAEYGPCGVGLRCAYGVCVRLSGPGGSCQEDFNCPMGFVCTSGTCDPLPVAGQACSADRPCLEGVCESGTCRLLAVGEACDPSEMELLSLRECAGYCDTDDVTGESACAAPGSLGAACSGDDECQTGLECTYDEVTYEETCTERCGW